jgi:hypothetical protein
MIRVLPIGHPAHTLDLDVIVRDPWTGEETTLAVLEDKASHWPTFGNVRALHAALDVAYPDWREPRAVLKARGQ